MSTTVEAATAIRPFHVDISDEALEDLRRRVAATNWPEKETVADQSQGVPLAMIQELARHRATEFDWAQGRSATARFPAIRDRASMDWTSTSSTSSRPMTVRWR